MRKFWQDWCSFQKLYEASLDGGGADLPHMNEAVFDKQRKKCHVKHETLALTHPPMHSYGQMGARRIIFRGDG